MSFLGPKPEGLDSSQPQRSETRFTGPVPILQGTDQLAFRHIEHPWNYRTEETGTKEQDPADYYSVAGWFCGGPVHALRQIHVGGHPIGIWMENPEDGSKYIDLEIPYYTPKHTPIRCRFYWGYDDQEVDPLLNGETVQLGIDVWQNSDDLLGGAQTPAGTGKHQTGTYTYRPAPNIHPPYGGICYAVFYAFETGWPQVWQNGKVTGGVRSAGPSLPDITFELFRRPTLVNGFESHIGVNPGACCHEYLTEPRFGLALPSSVVPTAEWQSFLDRVVALRGDGLHQLSPVLASFTAAASAISKINAYYGGLLLARDGKILPGILPEKGDGTFSVAIANSGFDTAGSGGEPFDGWTAEGVLDPVRDTADKYSGESSMRMDVGASWADSGIVQTLKSLVVGKVYVLELWAKATAGSGLRIGSNSNWAGYGTVSPGTDWAKHEVQFTAADTALHFHLSTSAPVNSHVWVDSILIREVVTEITEHDLIGEPEFFPVDSEDPISEVTVKYLDISDNLETDSITERVPMPGIVRGEPITKEVDGEYLRTSLQSRLYAQRILAGRAGHGKMTILRNKAKNPDGTAFLAGDLFHFDYGPWNLDVTLRITERDDRGDDSIQVSVDIERGLFPENYSPTEDPRELPGDPIPEPFVHYEAIELPLELGGNLFPAKMAVLAQRENDAIYGFDVYLSSNTDPGSRWTGEERLLATQTSFAVHGSLGSAMTVGDTQVTINVDSIDYNHFLAEGFSDDDRDDNEMLVLVGNEYLSLGALVSSTGSSWTFECVRGRAYSDTDSHDSGAAVWLIKKSLITPLQHSSFENAPLTVYLRIIPKVIVEDGEASAEFPLTISNPAPDNVTDLAVASHDPDKAEAKITWTDPDHRKLHHLELFYAEETEEAGVYGELIFVNTILPGVQEYTQKEVFVQNTAKNWKWVCKAIAPSEHVSDEPWPEVIYEVQPIPGLTNFAITTRGASSGGLLLHPTWDDDGTDSFVEFRYARIYSGLHLNGKVSTNEMDQEDALINIPLEDLADGSGEFVATPFWLEAYRVVVVNGMRIYSAPHVVDSITVYPDNLPPSNPTNFTVGSWDPVKGLIPGRWDDSTDPLVDHYEIYRVRQTSTAYPSFDDDDLFQSVAPGIGYFEDLTPYVDQYSYRYHYWLVAVKRGGAKSSGYSLNQQWDYTLPTIPAAPSVNVSGSGTGPAIVGTWTPEADGSEDDQWLVVQTAPNDVEGNKWETRRFSYGDGSFRIPIRNSHDKVGVSSGWKYRYWRASGPYGKAFESLKSSTSTVTVPKDTTPATDPLGLTISAFDRIERSLTLDWVYVPAEDIAGTWILLQITDSPTAPASWSIAHVIAGVPKGVEHYEYQVLNIPSSTKYYHFLIQQVDEAGNPSTGTTFAQQRRYQSVSPLAVNTLVPVSAVASRSGPCIQYTWDCPAGYENYQLDVYGTASDDTSYSEARFNSFRLGDESGKLFIPPKHEKIGVSGGIITRWQVRSGPHGAPVVTEYSSNVPLTVLSDNVAPANPASATVAWLSTGANIEWTNPQEEWLMGMELQRKYGSGPWGTIGIIPPTGDHLDSSVPPNTNSLRTQSDFSYRLRSVDLSKNAPETWLYCSPAGKRAIPTPDWGDVGLSVSHTIVNGSIIVEASWDEGFLYQWPNLLIRLSDGSQIRDSKLIAGSDAHYQSPTLQSIAGTTWTVTAFVLDEYGNYSVPDSESTTH